MNNPYDQPCPRHYGVPYSQCKCPFPPEPAAATLKDVCPWCLNPCFENPFCQERHHWDLYKEEREKLRREWREKFGTATPSIAKPEIPAPSVPSPEPEPSAPELDPQDVLTAESFEEELPNPAPQPVEPPPSAAPVEVDAVEEEEVFGVEAVKPRASGLPDPNLLPSELLTCKRTIGYRKVWDDSKRKYKKIPCSPITGKAIGATRKYEADWLIFEEAGIGIEHHGLAGASHVFVKEDKIVGIDFDGSRQNGVLHPEVATWFKWFPSFTETSISGTGDHVYLRGDIAKALTATKLPNAPGVTVEIYNDSRHFVISGQRVGEINEIVDCQVGLEKLIRALGTVDPKALDSLPRGKKVDTLAASLEPQDADGEQKPLSAFMARKIYEDNLYALRHARMGEGNALLNTCLFFAGRAYPSGVLSQTEEQIKDLHFQVATKEWKHPHDEVGARATIESGWRSGKENPLIIKEDEFPQLIAAVEELNQGYFLVKKFGSRARVCSEEQAQIGQQKGKQTFICAQQVGDFKIAFANQLVKVGVKEDGTAKLEDKASAWIRHAGRREYTRVVFKPEQEVPKDYYNLWRGFAYEPKRGDCSLYLAHLRDNVCLNDPIKYKYLIGWMGYAVQHPNEQGHVAVVIQGLKGVGKNVMAQGFANLFGQHQMVVNSEDRITKNFNAHLRDKVILVADEAFYAGSRKHEGILKGLITGDTIVIEAKGVDVETTPNLLHLIILGNEKWLVPASFDERRFFVLTCGPKQQQKQAYFKAIDDQLNAGGYEALLYHLKHEIDLSHFNVREAPKTPELGEQVTESLRGAAAAWNTCLTLGQLPGRVMKDGTAEVNLGDFLAWANNYRHRYWDQVNPQHIVQIWGKPGMDLNTVGLKQRELLCTSNVRKNEVGKGKLRYWTIPTLAKCRELRDVKYGKIDWEGFNTESDWAEFAREDTSF